MPSSILFSNATFDEPAQGTVLRLIESVKRKELEDDTLKLYESYSKDFDKVEKKEIIIKNNSILGSVDNYVEHQPINTIFESQTSKIDEISDVKPLAKKRKLKLIPNQIEVVKTIDAKNKTINLMTKVNVDLCTYY